MLVQKLGVKRVLLTSIALSAIVTLFTPFATDFGLILREILFFFEQMKLI